MMDFYCYDEIKERANCREIAATLLGATVNLEGRCAAVWRGGGNPTAVSLEKEQWYDHVQETGGSVIDLVAIAQYNGNVFLAQQKLGEVLGLSPKISTVSRLPGEAPRNRHERLVDQGYKEKARYKYTDRDGKLIHQVVRMEHPDPAEGQPRKEFLQCDADGAFSVKHLTRQLYNLPGIVGFPWAVVCEGEKDVDTLKALKVPATTNAGGAEKWQSHYSEDLAEKDVVIIADNDDKGKAHSMIVAGHLKDKANSIRIVTISALPKGDVTDWIEKEGGTKDKFIAIVKDLKPLEPADIPEPDQEDAAVRAAKEANKYPLCNYFLVDEPMPNGKIKKVPKPRRSRALIEEVHKRFLGFPRKVGELMFDHDRDSGRINHLQTVPELFSWIQRKSKQHTDWKRGSEFTTKEELLAGIRAEAVRYEAISHVPDWPTRQDVYYTMREMPPPSEGCKVLEGLIRFFSPASEEYEAYLRAFIAAPIFYKYGIPRPLWIIDSEDGQNTGKTTLAEIVAYLYRRPPIMIRQREFKSTTDELAKRLVTPDGRLARVFLIDNVTGDFRSRELSSLITSADITARPPYGHTEETRPNNLTYVITANSATVDTDLASRSFWVQLRRGNINSQWKETVMQYVHENRAQIFADILHRLETHKVGADDITPTTRYPEFEERVLRAMCRDFDQYNAAVKMLADSRASSNIDEDHANQIEDIIRAELVELGVNPEEHTTFITTPVLKAWIDAEINGIGNPIQAVRNYAKTGLMPRIDKTTTRRRHGERRSSGVRWLSAEAGAEFFIIVKRNRQIVAEAVQPDFGK